MNDEPHADSREKEQVPQDRSMMRRRRAALGYDGRSERRALRGAARRRKMRTRLWLVTAPAVVVIAVVVVLLVLFGGPDDPQTALTTSTTLAAAKGQGALLAVEEGGALQAAVVFQAREAGGMVLVVPGLVLLRDNDRFVTLAELLSAGGPSMLAGALDSVFGTQAKAVASVSWQTLREALASAGSSALPSSLATQTDDVQLADALQQLANGAGFGLMWESLGLQGDSTGFRAALEAAAGSAKQWTTVAVTGRLVEGDGYSYVEPDVAVARALLSGTAADADTTVELRNGSGAVGVVEAAAAQLQPLGYRVTPAGNAEGFPNVTQTVISYSAGAAQAAARVQALLGVGVALESDDLTIDLVVVVLGSDYAPPSGGAGGSR
jgi:hypothetical protein